MGKNGKRLCLSYTDKKLAGVCGGVAEYFGFEPSIVRIVFIILTLLFRGWFVFVYFLLWAVLPSE